MESFIYSMCPLDEITDSNIVKLVVVAGTIPDTDSAYKKQLDEQIELMIRCKTLKEMAMKD